MEQCSLATDSAERYVDGTMPEEERSAFEEHYFTCDSCFGAVQALQDAQAVLSQDRLPGVGPAESAATPARRGLPLTWMALAAALVLAVFVWRVPRSLEAPAPTSAPAPAAAPADAVAAPGAAPAPAVTPSLEPDRLTRLGALVPPAYVPLATRSEEGEQAAAFEKAMLHYVDGRYEQAARDLGTIAASAPELPHVQFFLGISELMSGNIARGRAALQRSAASNAFPYADEAHFYLAKAAIRARDFDAARRELAIAVKREAGPSGEAARLLADLKGIQK
jgi:tetratricopeptide (TPR) repeat protein